MSEIRIQPVKKKKDEENIRIQPLEETNHAQNYNLNGTKKLAPISKSIINGINNRGIKERLNTTLENLSQTPLSTPKEKIDLSGKSYFKDTGKTYGDYYYDNYAQNKDKKIYINTNDKKYYINTNGKYQRLNKLDENGNIISDNVMTTTEIEKQKKQEAIRQGYKDNSSNKITSQEYDNAQSTFKKLQKEYKLTDKELNEFIETGNLNLSNISVITKEKNKIREDAIKYREKLKNKEIDKYDSDKTLTKEQQIYLDTTPMSEEEKNQYINFLTGKYTPVANNDTGSYFKIPNVLKDGYQPGDISKAILGTATSIGSSALTGIGNFVENTSDFITNLVGTGLETMFGKDGKTQITKLDKNNKMLYGYKYGNQNFWLDKDKNILYDDNGNLISQFNINNLDKQKEYKNDIARLGSFAKEVVNNENEVSNLMMNNEVFSKLRDNSILGNKSEAMVQSMTETLPTMALGAAGAGQGTTAGMIFETSYAKAKSDAIQQGYSESNAIKSALSSAMAETISEQFFEGVPGMKVAGWGEKLVDNIALGTEKYFGSKAGKIVSKALSISGEGFEEIISNALNAANTDFIHHFYQDFDIGNQTGNISKDVLKELTSKESWEAFTSAIITSAILNTGTAIINHQQQKNIISAYAEDRNISYAEAKKMLLNSNNSQKVNDSETSSINIPQNITETNLNKELSNNSINTSSETKSPEIMPKIAYQYISTNNEKINTLRKSASQYLNNSVESQNLVNTIEKVVQDKNYNIVFDNKIKNKFGKEVNAKISALKNGEIEIKLNPNSDRAGEFLLVHEITHAIETNDMKDLVLKYANKNKQFNESLESLKQTYGTEDVSSEVIADISGQLFGNQEFINNLSTKQPNIFKRIYNKIIELANKITRNTKEGLFIKDLKNKWEEAYKNSNKQDAFNNLNSETEYHTSKNIWNDISNALNGYNTDSHVMLRDYTPKQLVSIGIEDLPMMANVSHLKENILTLDEAKNKGLSVVKGKHYHGLGIDTYIKAVDSLDNPIAIYQWQSNNKNKYNENNYVILTNIKDSNGLKIIVPIEINKKGNYNNVELDINKINTIYGKGNIYNYFLNNVSDGSMKLIYQKRSNTNTLQSGTNIASTANNIPQSNNNVNSDISSTKYSMPYEREYSSSGGYDGHRMSNRAIEAYNHGEKPLSKWSKKDIIDEINNIAYYNDIDLSDVALSKLTLKELQDNFLNYSSWHHTGQFYNSTNFYEIDENSVLGITKEKINKIKENRIPRKKLSDEERQQVQQSKENLEKSKEIYKKLDTIFVSGITNLKTLRSVYSRWANNKLDLEQVYNESIRKIKEDDANKIKNWERLPEDHWKKKYIQLYHENIIEYINKEYLSSNNIKTGILSMIKKDVSNNKTKYSMQNNENNTQELDDSSFSNNHKQKQLDVIKNNNPANDVYHTWIRNVEDIKTLEETINDSDWIDYDEYNPDLSRQDIENAIESGKIIVYSSYPVEQGIFVSPSKMEAESYSGNGKVYSKEVNINDVAWLDPTQGQYAKVNDTRYSQQNDKWQEHLEKNYKSSGTITYFENIRKNKVNPPIIRDGVIVNKIQDQTQNRNEKDIIKETKNQKIEERVNKAIQTGSYKALGEATKAAKKYLDFSMEENNEFKSQLEKYKNATYEQLANPQVYNEIRDLVSKYANREIKYIDEDLKSVKSEIRSVRIKVDENLRKQITDYSDFRKSNFGKLNLTNETGISVDALWNDLKETYPHYFNNKVNTEADMLYELSDFMNKDITLTEKYRLHNEELESITSKVFNELKNQSLTKEEIENLQKSLQNKYERKTRQVVMQELLSEMGIDENDISFGKDINSINYQMTDPIRLNEKVFGQEIGKKINEATIEKTKHNTAQKIRWLNKEREEISAFGIKARSKESAAVQKYAEGKYVNKYDEVVEYNDHDLMAEFPNSETQEKIKRVAYVLRSKYDEYLDQINGIITELGYDPIPKRKDYMRHFQELGDVFSQSGVPFNLNDMKEEDLPTDINGLTEFNKPGKSWFASTQKRTGVKSNYDAITGIDGYLEGAANLIFHTEDIQRYRTLSKFIRNTYGQTHGFENLNKLSEKEAKQRIADIQSNKLNKYVYWLDEQANSLAGKKAATDRSFERTFGRRAYTFLNTVKKQVGSNMTGYNVRSSLTNLISSTIASSKTNKIALVKGTISTINNYFKKDGFIDKSDFLTARFGSDNLSQKVWQKISNAGQIFMNGTDYLTANLITRSKYYEGLQKGMSESDAIKYADDFGARVMGDRSQGSTAEIFNSKVKGLFTQFQLEVNNQWQYMIHDTKVDFQRNSQINGGLKAGATALFQLGQLAAYSYFFNQLFESLTGSRAAFDPIDIFKTLFSNDDKKWYEKIAEANKELVDNIPFVNIFIGGGRIPVSEAFTGLSTLGKKITNQTDAYGGEITWEQVGKDILKTMPYYALPTGYGQVKKTVKGLSMFSKDKPIPGSYTDSGRLRFPVKDTFGKRIQAGLFGGYASEEAREYMNGNYVPLKEEQQVIYKCLDVSLKDYHNTNDQIKKIKKKYKDQNVEFRKHKIFEYIDSLNLTEDQKNLYKKLQYPSYHVKNVSIREYLKSLNLTKEEKKEIYKQLNFDK